MKRATLLLWLFALALAVVVGCSSDQPTEPARHHVVLSKTDAVIGPSRVVIALDVSDSVSNNELNALVVAVKTVLGDGTLVPQDGSIAVGALVYGDTIAAPFDGLVPVTAENLDNVILPALSGLTTDRLVGGSVADVARAMEAAGSLLPPGPVMDRHVLVVGSGAAADTAAVRSAAATLKTAGIMISAVTLRGSPSLASAAAATGGYFAGPVTDAFFYTGEAMAYMLRVDLTVSGSAPSLPRFTEFTATASLFRGGEPLKFPLVGRNVVFQVVAGPNSGEPVTAVTDTAGLAKYRYGGYGGPGTDVVVASAVHPGSGLALTDTVRVAWLNAIPQCDAGGPYTAVVRSDTVRVTLDGSRSSDADGDTLRFAWVVGCHGAMLDDSTAVRPTVTLTGDCLCSGDVEVALVVNDGFNTSTCETSIHLQDLRPPVIVVRPDPLVLWPPNHKYTTYRPDMFVLSVTDACGRPIDPDAISVAALEVRSDEPDDANGDGHTTSDILVNCPNDVSLRAERMGGGDGRVYTIVYRFRVGDGQPVDVPVKVVVPHDASSHVAAESAGGFRVVPDCTGEK
jgi:hypothetical protein